MKALWKVLAAVTMASEVHAGLTFSFTYSDVGTGFNDPSTGVSRQAALESAVSTLGSYFPGYTANLAITVSSFSNPSSSLLANASSQFGASIPGFKSTVLQTKVLSNGATDANGAGADATFQFNFGHAFDLDDSVSPSLYDFKSVAMHELMHAMGFASFIEADGTGMKIPAVNLGDQDVYSVFDKFVTDGTGKNLIKADFRYDVSIPTSVLTGNPGVYFGGANAVAAYGGLVPLYSPTTYAAGSSISHSDGGVFGGVNALLMNPSTGTGPGIRTLSDIEVGILKDMGYAVVPEPAAGAALAGVVGLAFGVWRGGMKAGRRSGATR